MQRLVLKAIKKPIYAKSAELIDGLPPQTWAPAVREPFFQVLPLLSTAGITQRPYIVPINEGTAVTLELEL